jgi:hypothetical protein
MALVIDNRVMGVSCVYEIADKVKENRFGFKNKINRR